MELLVIYFYINFMPILIFLSMKKYRKSYENNKIKISASTWNEKFELPGGSYSLSDIEDYFEYI